MIIMTTVGMVFVLDPRARTLPEVYFQSATTRRRFWPFSDDIVSTYEQIKPSSRKCTPPILLARSSLTAMSNTVGNERSFIFAARDERVKYRTTHTYVASFPTRRFRGTACPPSQNSRSQNRVTPFRSCSFGAAVARNDRFNDMGVIFRLRRRLLTKSLDVFEKKKIRAAYTTRLPNRFAPLQMYGGQVRQ